jgi:hypothetical protein
MALALGAPVTEPQGKVAASSASSVTAGERRASTVEVSCQTVR